MGKVFIYIILVVGMMLLFNMAGLQTTSSEILGKFGLGSGNYDTSKFDTTQLSAWAKGILIALIAVGGISIGFYGTTVSDIAVTALLSIPLLLFISDLYSIISTASQMDFGVFRYVIALIMIPLIFGYAISIVEWVRGRD